MRNNWTLCAVICFVVSAFGCGDMPDFEYCEGTGSCCQLVEEVTNQTDEAARRASLERCAKDPNCTIIDPGTPHAKRYTVSYCVQDCLRMPK